MPQSKTENKETFLDRLRGHHHHDEHKNENQEGDKPTVNESGLRETLKKDEEGAKKYLKEDQKLEEEGDIYGGLM
ncbi:hypothetical protein BJY01DRAFT_247646 [Aspergillus pseudoustus]|uniref:Uncharacterized protein n=1 Tax=Aspergillus pseudoustus TaxID=1810923 RepID=A0ABR4JZM4_9EURO